jgi:hypothetical protein
MALLMTSAFTGRTGVLVVLSSLLVLNGCASYYTHYAMFPAETSAGETRQVRVSWQSAEYPGWWLASNKATPIRLETQCSERVWRITDPSHRDSGACAEGVRACGEPGKDLLAVTGQPVTGKEVCLEVEQGATLQSVADIGSSFGLLVSCRPQHAVVRYGDEEVNLDYLRPSPVAYIVHARKVPRGTLSARLPSFNESECKED